MDERKKILWRSLLLTILIFAAGILLNHLFDTFRISIIENIMTTHEIDSEAYRAEKFFTETFGGDTCEIMITRISDLKKEIRKVGEDLGSYSKFSFFRRKDYDYLKRKYFLLELRFLALIEKLNKECDKPYLPIIFFYKIDDDASERQGFILQDLSEEYDQQLVVLSIDKDYKDEPLVNLLAKNYNVTEGPTLIIDGVPHTGLMYTGEINASVQRVFKRADPYAQNIDFQYTIEATGINTTQLLEQIEKTSDEKADNWARADAKLITGRLTKNQTQICESLAYYDKINSTKPEEMALVHETSASLGCGRNRPAFLRAAATEWRKTGSNWRAEILEKLARGRFNPKFEIKTIQPNLNKTNAKAIVIGKTTITLDKTSTIVSQEDRVHRDWLSGQLASPYGPEILTTFSEKLTLNATELMPETGWHEGARIKELKSINLTHIPAVGTLAAKKDGKWYAADENGTFRFEVASDKISYPTTRFLRRDLAVIIDTHGINTLVEQAIRNKADAVIGCCDSESKITAAEYLSNKGIPVICYTDKYLYLALGHQLNITGSPPTTIKDKAIIGNRQMRITTKDIIVAVNSTSQPYALWYYQTPASYFEQLSKAIDLNITYVKLTDFKQMEKATQKAREINATVLATRVFNSQDYEAISKWLDEEPHRRAVLFHSASYPYGQKIFKEYPNRTTFDDPNPVFV